jgi:hypothetical protein
MCRYHADEGQAWIAWITPLREATKIEGYALWLVSIDGAPEDPPMLRGVFDSMKDAKAVLCSEGIIGKK